MELVFLIFLLIGYIAALLLLGIYLILLIAGGMYWLIFLAGMMLGGTVGVCAMCLFFVSKESDRQCPDIDDEIE